MRYLRTILLILSLFLSFSINPVNAAGNNVLLVGVTQSELSANENQALLNKKIQEIPFSGDWQEDIKIYQPDQIIIKQPSGYVGLYEPSGNLIRKVGLVNPPNISQYTLPEAAYTQEKTYAQKGALGYTSGGTIDPYSARTGDQRAYNYYYNRNQQNLAPGWGYNQIRPQPSKGNAILNFLSFAPLDTVTPFNYPGNFGGGSISSVYGLGVLPHVGGLFLELKRAGQNQRQADTYRTQVPFYSEQPIQYYNPSEPLNPVSRDPNQFRYYPMPQSFDQANPEFHNQANEYQIKSQPLKY